MPARDVNEADFTSAVLERSFERPVVVDFWASWCAPCRTLGPIIERIADQHAGEVDLVKVDVDSNQSIAQAYGIQGIPAVKAFRNGAVVEEFVGAIPEPAVRAFFDAVVPSEADRITATGDAAAEPEEAERAYRKALEIDPGHRGANVGLAETLAERGEFEEAKRVLARIPEDADVRRLRAHIDIEEAAKDAPPDDPLARARTNGDWEPVLEQLLHEVREGDREEARQKMIDVFEVLGPDHPLTQKYRSQLARALF